MLNIGITGGIGSGKTTVCKIFNTLGIPIYYADDRAKTLMTEDPKLVAAIIREFGNKAYINGQLNRPYIAEKAFNDASVLKTLNGLVHPVVAKDALAWTLKQNNVPYTLREAALLFEAGSYKFLDKIIVVTAPEEMRIERVMKRDNITEQEVKARIAKQWPESEKASRADYIITNDGKNSVIKQVLKLHKQLLALS